MADRARNDPDQTTDLPSGNPLAPPGAEPPRSADSERPTVRRADTSVGGPAASDLGPVPTYETDTFDPARTGGYTPAPGEKPHPTTPAVPGYVILGELGRGGMGVVYKARHAALDRVVALKMVLAGPHASEDALARFQAEAQAVARLQHPNIVQVFEVGRAGGLPYFSLEFVDGGPLSRKVAREPQPPRFAAQTVATLARAMQYAHERDVVHRDLKPANVLLAADGTPKVTDFGLAKQLGADSGQTQSGQVLGTPSYMAPEQAAGDAAAVGPAADVYALGAILYDLLTGRPPFAGSSVLDTLEMVRTREPVPPGALAAKVPRDLETVCLKCLQKDPARRYASAGALADDLRRFLDGRPIVARPVSAAEKAWRWAKRNPAGALAAALGAVVVVGLPVFSWQLYLAKGEAERNAVAANREKEEATKERDEKEKARAAEEAARRKEAAARDLRDEQLKLSLDVIRGVLLHIDDRMRNSATLLPVRRSILDRMKLDLDRLRKHAADNPLADRSEGVAYARFGEVDLRSHRVQDAYQALQRAHAVFDRLQKDNPTDPVNWRNLAAITNQLGDVELRLGNAGKARDRYAEGLRLRRRWAELLPPADVPVANQSIAQSYELLGKIAVRLGDPAAALAHFRASEKQYAELPADSARRPDVRREVANVRDRLGQSHFLTGDSAEAENLFRAAARDRDALVKEFGKHPGFGPVVARDRTLSRLSLGDFYLVRGEPAKAWGEYGAAYDAFAGLLRADPDNLDTRRDFSAVHYRVGATVPRLTAAAPAVLGSAAGPALAARHFDAALRLRTDLARIDPQDTQGQIDLMLAQGRCGKPAEAAKVAGELLKQAGDDRRVLFQVACGLSVAGDNPGPVAARCREQAFEVLAALTRQGWKDRVSLETDPDLDAVRADPQFRAILSLTPFPALAGNRRVPNRTFPRAQLVRSEILIPAAARRGGETHVAHMAPPVRPEVLPPRLPTPHPPTSDRSFAVRVANLQGEGAGPRANGAVVLTTAGAGATASDDAAEDVLTGGAGADWFLFNADGTAKDKVVDMSTYESLYAEDLDFMGGPPVG